MTRGPPAPPAGLVASPDSLPTLDVVGVRSRNGVDAADCSRGRRPGRARAGRAVLESPRNGDPRPRLRLRGQGGRGRSTSGRRGRMTRSMRWCRSRSSSCPFSWLSLLFEYRCAVRRSRYQLSRLDGLLRVSNVAIAVVIVTLGALWVERPPARPGTGLERRHGRAAGSSHARDARGDPRRVRPSTWAASHRRSGPRLQRVRTGSLTR